MLSTITQHRFSHPRPRKRKVRDERGHWVDPKDLEGRVIEHGVAVEEGKFIRKRFSLNKTLLRYHIFLVKARPKRTIRRPKHLHDDDFRHGYDPFRLVPLEQYDEGPPFKVDIVSDALVCSLKCNTTSDDGT
jgi:protein MYSM1